MGRVARGRVRSTEDDTNTRLSTVYGLRRTMAPWAWCVRLPASRLQLRASIRSLNEGKLQQSRKKAAKTIVNRAALEVRKVQGQAFEGLEWRAVGAPGLCKHGQKRDLEMDRLLILDPQDLTLRFEVGKKAVGMVKLTNVMHTMPVAYKIQTSAPRKYSFKPPHAIIPPLGQVTVEIAMHAQNELPECFPQSSDKFTVKSVVVPGGYSSEAVVSVDWFTARRKAVFSDTRLRVVLVGGGILRALVSRAAIEQMREVLDLDPLVVDAADERGCTAMHVAVAMKRPELVQILLEYKANLELRNKAGQSALQLAAQAGEALIAELLLANGAATESANAFGWTALHCATVKGHCAVMRLLLDGHANIDAHTHSHGRGRGPQALRPSAAREALQYVRNSRDRTPFDDAADAGHTLLFDVLLLGDALRHAARRGELNSVQKCVHEGAVVDGDDQYGWTALHRAAFKGRLDVVKFLIENGADLKLKDEEGFTALHMAVESGHKEVVHLLVSKGAYVNEKTKKGLTALQLATAMKYVGIVRILLEGGASRNASIDPDRWRPVELTNDSSKGSFGERYFCSSGLRSEVH
ncbi:hypothetical protein AXG93_669s1120 [Marchantia polymorpha subsp. ruderalis]|uniref:MSP domain-containing protein n=1 Tax=Marchantia polymorpha subsp. ruderalis TaxID=1480154 RepID=A0A176WB85_MARPO|nr:hypothetical protein AXG93_669s1120 [Marchantia polymorpha subsp. ruderalis]